MKQRTPPEIDQLSAMRLGVDYSEIITCRKFSLKVRPLSMLETLQVAQETQQEMALKDEFSRHRLSENEIYARQTLIKATSSDVGANDSQLTDYIVQRMTAEEFQYLFKQYVAVVDKKNPCLELLKGEELQKLVDALKKSPEETLGLHLTELSFSELVSVCHALIREGLHQAS